MHSAFLIVFSAIALGSPVGQPPQNETAVTITTFLATFTGKGGLPCVAAAITESTIITASHCVPNLKGQTSITFEDEATAKAAGWKTHEEFNAANATSYNIASAAFIADKIDGQLPTEIETVDPAETEPIEGVTAILRPSNASLVVVSVEKCLEAYGEAFVEESMFCAAPANGECTAEYDGGLLLIDEKLAGIAASGTGCGTEEKPALFTNVLFHKTWISARVLESRSKVNTSSSNGLTMKSDSNWAEVLDGPGFAGQGVAGAGTGDVLPTNNEPIAPVPVGDNELIRATQQQQTQSPPSEPTQQEPPQPPPVQDTTSLVQDTTPLVQDTTPPVQDTTPLVQDTTPPVQDTQTTVTAQRSQSLIDVFSPLIGQVLTPRPQEEPKPEAKPEEKPQERPEGRPEARPEERFTQPTYTRQDQVQVQAQEQIQAQTLTQGQAQAPTHDQVQEQQLPTHKYVGAQPQRQDKPEQQLQQPETTTASSDGGYSITNIVTDIVRQAADTFGSTVTSSDAFSPSSSDNEHKSEDGSASVGSQEMSQEQTTNHAVQKPDDSLPQQQSTIESENGGGIEAILETVTGILPVQKVTEATTQETATQQSDTKETTPGQTDPLLTSPLEELLKMDPSDINPSLEETPYETDPTIVPPFPESTDTKTELSPAPPAQKTDEESIGTPSLTEKPIEPYRRVKCSVAPVNKPRCVKPVPKSMPKCKAPQI